MSKLVKLTDKIGNELEKWAKEDGCTLAGEIKNLLDIRAGKGVYDGINSRLDKMAEYLDKKFGHLESLIEDTTIDRLDRGRRKSKTVVLDWEWPDIQTLLYDIATEKDYVTKSDYDEMHESSCADSFKWYIEENQVWGDFFGEKKPYLNISSDIANFLTSKGVVWQQ